LKVNIKIKRFNGIEDKIDSFSLKIEDRTTIVEALIYIKDNIDPSLSFRVQCRSAICGTCAVKVGDKHILACKTKVKDLLNENNEILIEPASNLPVIKDLITDQSVFLEKLKLAKPWLISKEEWEPIYPEDLKKFEKETDCILCGACYSACPAFEADKNFGGPINFVKIYRFWKDKNDFLEDERVKIAVNDNKISSCVHCKYCTFMCPKEIPVEQDITQIEFYAKQKGYIKQDNQQFGGFGFGFGSFGNF